MFVSSSGINPSVPQQWETQEPTDAIVDLDNKDILNIQPEDMLVPLSELQPKTINITTNMQAIQQQPSVTQAPVENQKIVICVRKVSVPNNKEKKLSTLHCCISSQTECFESASCSTIQ